ncbi:hypothetical protein DhcVS_496 [Dehalococcoides mccartyi VS]|uniref:ATP synthase protein I n=2 Tax=Dehalococcoides mccartyi TaxID=61435 RepID=D2BH50_DEHMV|nr:hypothetical protein DhcVS_496 [Dehalococcoides mccartyi VS]
MRFEAVMNKWGTGLQYLGLGWYIALVILLGTLGGRWLDETLDLSPLFLLIGLLSGVFLAFYGVYRLLPKITNNGKGN